MSSTIFALATGRMSCGVSIVRVSGIGAYKCIKTMTRLPHDFAVTCPRKLTLTSILYPTTNYSNDHLIDRGLVVFFPGPASFTGEDVVEFHCHGSLAVVKKVLLGLSSIPGYRASEPGEFTYRAFINRKMDLAQVEGLQNLLQAETEFQRRQALSQATGFVSKHYLQWQKELVDVMAILEGYLDFGDDEQLPQSLIDEAKSLVKILRDKMSKLVKTRETCEIIRTGLSVSIIGEPNVGKSSLMNILVGRDSVLVSEKAGTTRDAIEKFIDIKGIPLRLTDTAGVRDTQDEIEKLGIQKSIESAQTSDLNIVMMQVQSDGSFSPLPILLQESSGDSGKEWNWGKSFFILNKCDQQSNLKGDDHEIKEKFLNHIRGSLLVSDKVGSDQIAIVSCLDGTGIPEFVDSLSSLIRNRWFFDINPSSESDNTEQSISSVSHLMTTTVRQANLLEDCIKALDHFEAVNVSRNPELLVVAVEHLRKACLSLGQITGFIDCEQILDQVFTKFCIGK